MSDRGHSSAPVPGSAAGDSSARHELEQIIARLEVISHVPAVNLDPTPAATDASKGGARPRGGIDRKDDREMDFALKSADHYRRRLDRAHTEGAVLRILADAKLTLRAWTHTPVTDQPLPGDPLFRRWVSQQLAAGKSPVDIARVSGVSRQYVSKIRDAA